MAGIGSNMFHAIKALTFDTGGTILDWHSGFRDALQAAGDRRGVTQDWSSLANELRRSSIARMRDTANRPENFDIAHAEAVEDLVDKYSLPFGPDEKRQIAYDAVHRFRCWPEVPGALPQLRSRFSCVSLTILSYRIVMDTARANKLHWDAILSCEGMSSYKPDPEVYLTAARFLQIDPSECCMVAAHNFDLDAARSVGFRTAFVRRPQEWGHQAPPDPDPNPLCDIVVNGLDDLVNAAGAAQTLSGTPVA